MGTLVKLTSLAFGLAGITKLAGIPAQTRLFRSWGWPDDVMRIIGGLELGGAVLLSHRQTRGLAGPALAATSIAVLAGELEYGEDALVPARIGMLLAALAAA